MEGIATCGYFALVWCLWRMGLWCPSYWLARRSLTLELVLVDAFGVFGGVCFGYTLEALEVIVGGWWCFSTWMIWRYSWRHFGPIGDLKRLRYDLEIDLETWHLTWSISWVGSQEPCLLVLSWSWLWQMMWLVEMMIRQMDMQWQWRYHSLFFLQAGSCTLWGLDSSNPSWLDPIEH